MRKILILSALVSGGIAFQATARGTWTIQSVEYSVDTLYHATVGPGTTETELRIEATEGSSSVVNNVFYTVTELDNPYVEMRVAKAGNHMRMLETVPEIAARMNQPGERYFAGINADFFNMGDPYNSIGMCVANGFLTNYATDGADIDPYYLIINNNGKPIFSRHVYNDWEGSMTFESGAKYSFHLNTRRGDDEILLYTPQWQFYDSYSGKMHKAGYTGTNAYGVEVKVRPVGENVLYGNSLQLEVIEQPEVEVGNMAIPADGYVISAHGRARKYISELKKGDIVIANIGFRADVRPTAVKEVVGGFPNILKSGRVLPAPSYPEHLSGPEPRSAVGYNEDKTRMIMLVVDGRNAGGSSGVTQKQLADIMRNIGCYDAMNFDGGGSSTMYIDGFGVKNVPSSSSLDKRPEGTPRTVVNGFFAVATAPVDNEIASIEIREKSLSLSAGESVVPVVYGYNQYGVLVSTDLQGCNFTVPEEIATVSGSAITATDGHYCGLLTADYNGLTYTIPVSINGGGEFITSAIYDTTVDNPAAEEYYMINGVKTAAPVPGQIIVTGGGKKTIIH